MVNVAYCLRRAHDPAEAKFSVLDLKAHWRGCKYVTDIIKMLPQKPDANLIADIFRRIAALGSIHPTTAHSAAP